MLNVTSKSIIATFKKNQKIPNEAFKGIWNK